MAAIDRRRAAERSATGAPTLHQTSIRLGLLAVLTAVVFVACQCWPVAGHADDGNLPVYTSPIDATGLRLQLKASVPDRDTGQMIDTPLPVGLLGSAFNEVMSTPLSTQMDDYWNVRPDPKTGKTPRQKTCDDIHDQVDNAVRSIGDGFTMYGYECNLAGKGSLLVSQDGANLTFGYTLFDSSLQAYVTTPYTCHAGNGFLCPDDPGVRLALTPQIVMTLQTPTLCGMRSSSKGTALIQSPDLQPLGSATVVAAFDTFLTGGFYTQTLEHAIGQVTKDVPLPLDGALAELRNSQACDPTTPAGHAIAAYSGIETAIEPAQGAIILRAIHKPIEAPVLPYTDQPTPSTPSFSHPSIAAPPSAAAGSTIKVTGQFFPQTADSNQISLQINHSLCEGTTDLDWGPADGATHVETFSFHEFSCTSHHPLNNLAPATAYRFRARDCDPVTCSPWSEWVTVTTGASHTPAVTLTLDGSPVGTANATAQGTFDADVVIPAGTAPGAHTIRAASGDAADQTSLQVTQGGTGAKSTLVLTGKFYGDRGCAMRPLPQQVVSTDSPFSAYGTGFEPGLVALYLDSATGTALGTATVGADGTFCYDAFNGPAANEVGNHTLVAVQNETVRLTTPVQVVRPNVVH